MSEEEKEIRCGEEPVEEKETTPEEKPERLEDTIYGWAQALIAAVVGVVLLFTFVVRLIGVSGPSMQNTLYTGDRVLVLNAMFCDFQAGDVVVARNYNVKGDLGATLVKRIVAVGGQTVDIDFVEGIVYVDGEAIDEPYIKEPTFMPEGLQFPVTLGENEVFLMGDNRNRSSDSRDDRLGPVDESYLHGKAIFLLVPGKTPGLDKMEWSRFGLIR